VERQEKCVRWIERPKSHASVLWSYRRYHSHTSSSLGHRDPVREPDTPSTKNELDAAIRLSETIAGWFEETGYVRPWIAVTGNGCCLYFFLPSKRINDGNRLRMTKRIVNFERWVRSNFKTEMEKHNCNIDSMYDLPRIVRVIGTYNIKGKNTTNRPWRLSYWLHKKTQRAVDQRLLGRLQRF